MSAIDEDNRELARGLLIGMLAADVDMLDVSEYLWEKGIPDSEADKIADAVKAEANRLVGFIREGLERGDI